MSHFPLETKRTPIERFQSKFKSLSLQHSHSHIMYRSSEEFQFVNCRPCGQHILHEIDSTEGLKLTYYHKLQQEIYNIYTNTIGRHHVKLLEEVVAKYYECMNSDIQGVVCIYVTTYLSTSDSRTIADIITSKLETVKYKATFVCECEISNSQSGYDVLVEIVAAICYQCIGLASVDITVNRPSANKSNVYLPSSIAEGILFYPDRILQVILQILRAKYQAESTTSSNLSDTVTFVCIIRNLDTISVTVFNDLLERLQRIHSIRIVIISLYSAWVPRHVNLSPNVATLFTYYTLHTCSAWELYDAFMRDFLTNEVINIQLSPSILQHLHQTFRQNHTCVLSFVSAVLQVYEEHLNLPSSVLATFQDKDLLREVIANYIAHICIYFNIYLFYIFQFLCIISIHISTFGFILA